MTTRPDGGPTAGRLLAISLVVWTAVVVSTASLVPLFSAGSWLWGVSAGLLGLSAVTAAGRLLGRLLSRNGPGVLTAVLPTVAAAALGAVAVLVEFGSPPGAREWIPGPEHWERLLARAEQARLVIAQDAPPVEPIPELVLVVSVGAGATLLLAECAVLALRAPLLLAPCVVGLWAPGVLLGAPTSWPLIGLVTGCLIVLLLLDPGSPARGAPGPAEPVGRTGGVAARAGAAVAACLALGLVLHTGAPALPGWGGRELPSARLGPSGPLTMSSSPDLRENLNRRADEVALVYRTTATSPDVLRLFTATSFDGASWAPPDRDTSVSIDRSELLWPGPVDAVGLPGAFAGRQDAWWEDVEQVSVQIVDLRQDLLPIPTEPRAVHAGPTWSYSPAADMVVGRSATYDGMLYDLAYLSRPLGPETLRGSGDVDPDDPAVRGALDLPDTSHRAELADLAREVVGGLSDPYDQAVALQGFLRDTTRFTYSTEVAAGTGNDAVWDFLQDGRGYCVQFATAMAVLARSVGIPARLGVGFLPGTLVDGDRREVTGADSHAWPELFLEGQGWVRFEPTPGVQSGPAPDWTAPQAPSGTPAAPTPEEPTVAPEEPTPIAPEPSVEPNATLPASPPAEDRAPGTGPLLWGLILLITAAGASVAIWAGLRRRRAPSDLEGHWAHLLSRLERILGTEREAADWGSRSPRQVPELVRDAVQARGARPSPRLEDRLRSMAEWVEESRYAGQRSTVGGREAGDAVREILTELRRCLSDRPRRDGGPSGRRAAP